MISLNTASEPPFGRTGNTECRTHSFRHALVRGDAVHAATFTQNTSPTALAAAVAVIHGTAFTFSDLYAQAISLSPPLDPA
jgi:hypothetical protein